jgi:pyruvate ferredoxin oxidoreductase delta subunit
MKAFVVIDRCKGCDLCAVVCNAAKHEAIIMAPVNASTGEINLTAHKAEAAVLGQAYQS